MQEGNKATESWISIESMTLPKGGGSLKGMGECTGVNCYTGVGTINIPIYATPCRDIEPSLSLEYSTVSGNGVFGMGFSLPIDFISRKTANKIPLYDDDLDRFILSNKGEMILQSVRKNSDGFCVRSYCLRKESSFRKIEYYKKEDKSFWLVTDRANTKMFFGTCAQSRISNPKQPNNVFSWRLSLWKDEKGNIVEYIYNEKNNLDTIRYGNCTDSGSGNFKFEIRLEYEPGRKDAFKSYIQGFPRETTDLCVKISMCHLFDGHTQTVRDMSLSYAYGELGSVALLEKVRVTGYMPDKKSETLTMSMPDIILAYQSFSPEGRAFSLLKTEDNVPFEMNNNNFFFVDLDGEGAAGILYADGETILYSSPCGNFQYSAPVALANFPSHRDLTHYRLVDLEGNGKYHLSVYSAELSGFYKRDENSWGVFSAFEHVASDAVNPSQYNETADLQGDKQKHLFTTIHDTIRYYPSEGTKGMGEPVTKGLPDGFPLVTHNSTDRTVRFLEMTGDGLEHRVLIENGNVEYYPNIGYARFGEKVVMKNAPYFAEGLDVRRVFFADLDGSGTADFIYIYPDKADIFFNISGTVYTLPISIPLPELYTKLDAVHFADINGDGTCCMVFSKIDSSGIRHYCYDFAGGKKPHLLTKMDNNMGEETEFYYKSSSQLYFQAKSKGSPWLHTLAFPVQLIMQTKEINAVTNTLSITEYNYRDGIYDYDDNEFSGFQFAEESTALYYNNEKYPSESTKKKTWFCPCSKNSGQTLSAHIIEANSIKDAKKSLWGLPIREEHYENNNNMYAETKQYRYKVTELASIGTRKAYFSHMLESLICVYENEAEDPRIEHEFNLVTDSFGNILRKCVATYPRNVNKGFLALPAKLQKAQSTVTICETESAFSNQSDGDIWRLGIPAEEKKYEYGNLPSSGIFSTETILPILDTACEKTLIGWKRFIYWDDALEAALPLGILGKQALLHHQEEAVFPEKFQPLEDFEDFIDAKEIANSGGYCLNDGYWWNKGIQSNYYGREKFYLLQGTESLPGSAFFHKESIEYDKYATLPVKWRQYPDKDTYNQTTAVINYRVMKYSELRDINDNIMQTQYNPLALATMFTEHGSCNGKAEGNDDATDYAPCDASFETVINNPENYLQGMTGFCFYDLLAWQERRQPISIVSLIRGNDKSSSRHGCINITVDYFDGYNNIETRRFAERGNWGVQNKRAYNREGKEIATYPAFFAESCAYNTGGESLPPTRIRYDRKGRLVRKDTPDTLPDSPDYGYHHSTVEYSPWAETKYDENRNVSESHYKKLFADLNPQSPSHAYTDKLNALEKAEKFNRKPVTQILDSRGNSIAELLESGLFVFREYDANKNLTAFSDPRNGENPNLRIYYDMRGRKIRSDSNDGGIVVQLENSFEKPAVTVNGNRICKTFTYDGLQRLSEVNVTDIGIVEKIEYGESLVLEESKNRNLRGQIHKHYDQSGVELFSSYTLRGYAHEKERSFCISYDQPDWAGSVALEPKTFKEVLSYNTANQITEKQTPDGNMYSYFYNRRGFLEKVSSVINGTDVPFIDSIYYCAGQKRVKITYANGAYTKFQYNRITARQEGTFSVRPGSNRESETIRSYNYTHDPCGHITRIRDNMDIVTCTRGQVTQPYLDYEYDELYRLKSAAGRELAGHKNDYSDIVGYVRNYAYDESGNMTKVQHISNAGKYNVNMSAKDFSNRLTELWKDNGQAENIFYDGSGNILNLPHLRSMDWDYDGRLKSAEGIVREESGSDEELYNYDYAGNRVRKITRRMTAAGIKETQKIYIGTFCAERVGDKTHSTMRVTDGETPLAVVNFEGTALLSTVFQISDDLNSVCVELNAKAEIVSAREYFPFGGVAIEWLNKEDAPVKERLYANKELDIITRFYYFETRYYSACLRRFISADSVENIKPGEWQSFNLYTFCHNDPVNYTDPDGRCSTAFDEIWGEEALDALTWSSLSYQIEFNRQNGKDFEKKVGCYLKQNPNYTVHCQPIFYVMDEGRLTKTIPDFLVTNATTRKDYIIDAKTGSGDLTPNQKIAYPKLSDEKFTILIAREDKNTDSIKFYEMKRTCFSQFVESDKATPF